MGVMSKTKGTRLPERPKPPSWEDITDDISAAGTDDIVFSVGRSNLPNVTAGQISREKINTSATSTDSNLDLSQTDPEEARESYESALRLIAAHERLSSVPSTLKEQYANLKDLGQSMGGSIAQLRELAKSVARETQRQQQQGSAGDGKPKSKQKKKK